MSADFFCRESLVAEHIQGVYAKSIYMETRPLIFDSKNIKYLTSLKQGKLLFSLVSTLYGTNARQIANARWLDYLADSVDAFLTESAGTANNNSPSVDGIPASLVNPPLGGADPDPPAVHLGLTFSFPVEQKALDSGLLLTWTKGFSTKNAIGNDVVKLLQDAFDRKHMHVKCVALVNDVSLLFFVESEGSEC